MESNRYFHDWIDHHAQQKKMLFAIVDPSSEWVPHKVFAQCDGQNGSPLLSLKQLTNAEDGPWLLPVNNEFLQWWSEGLHAQSGVLIATQAPDKVREHFANLFQAVLLGELVFFPFYRPEYLGSMLPRLQFEELNLLLAGHSLLLRCDNEWKNYDSQDVKVTPLQPSPWWVIKEHHLSDTPNIALLTSNVESWLWQQQPILMLTKIENNLTPFQTEFQRIFSALNDTHPLIKRVVMTAIIAVYGESPLNREDVQEALDNTQNDELLFALRDTFAQLQGVAS